MEVEWTLGSVLASDGSESFSEGASPKGSSGMDGVLIALSALLTAAVALFCCARVSAGMGGGRKVGKGGADKAQPCPTNLLTMGLATKAAIFIH